MVINKIMSIWNEMWTTKWSSRYIPTSICKFHVQIDVSSHNSWLQSSHVLLDTKNKYIKSIVWSIFVWLRILKINRLIEQKNICAITLYKNYVKQQQVNAQINETNSNLNCDFWYHLYRRTAYKLVQIMILAPVHSNLMLSVKCWMWLAYNWILPNPVPWNRLNQSHLECMRLDTSSWTWFLPCYRMAWFLHQNTFWICPGNCKKRFKKITSWTLGMG